MESKKWRRFSLRKVSDREMTCPQAFHIAEKHKITKSEISKYCNAHKIKMKACQLGCFK